MLKNIKIESFKSISSLEIDGFKRVNLFVGKNNSSKTTVLEAIFLSLGISNPQLIININHFRGLVLNQADDFRFIFNNLEYDRKIKIITVFDKQKREFTIEPSKSAISNPIASNKTSNQNDFQLRNASSTIQESFDQLILNFSTKEFQKKETKYLSKITFNPSKGFEIEIDKKYKEQNIGLFITSKTLFYSNLTKSLENLIITKKEKNLISYLSKVDERIVDVKIGVNDVIYFDVGLARLIPASLIGDGVLKLMNILLAIMDYKNGFVIIDEIDNGLHYSVLKNLWRLIFDVSEECNTQLFISTHSFETLKYLKEVLEEKDYEKNQNEVRSYTLKKNIHNDLKVYSYNFLEFEYSINQGIEIR